MSVDWKVEQLVAMTAGGMAGGKVEQMERYLDYESAALWADE